MTESTVARQVREMFGNSLENVQPCVPPGRDAMGCFLPQLAVASTGTE